MSELAESSGKERMRSIVSSDGRAGTALELSNNNIHGSRL